VNLSPIAAEITYGLERIAMFLQKVDNVFDLEWAPGVTYGQVRLREEIEQSKYAFNQDTGISAEDFAAFHRSQFDACYGFAERLVAARLLLPALEYCLKCSHLFNLLDSSGSIGVSERTAYILRVRQLAVRLCRDYAAEADARAAAAAGAE
jgi:glycyl-tRNA synthetase alpha chain